MEKRKTKKPKQNDEEAIPATHQECEQKGFLPKHGISNRFVFYHKNKSKKKIVGFWVPADRSNDTEPLRVQIKRPYDLRTIGVWAVEDTEWEIGQGPDGQFEPYALGYAFKQSFKNTLTATWKITHIGSDAMLGRYQVKEQLEPPKGDNESGGAKRKRRRIRTPIKLQVWHWEIPPPAQH